MRFLAILVFLPKALLFPLIVSIVHVVVIWNHANHLVVVVGVHKRLVDNFDLEGANDLAIVSAVAEFEFEPGELFLFTLLEIPLVLILHAVHAHVIFVFLRLSSLSLGKLSLRLFFLENVRTSFCLGELHTVDVAHSQLLAFFLHNISLLGATRKFLLELGADF